TRHQTHRRLGRLAGASAATSERGWARSAELGTASAGLVQPGLPRLESRSGLLDLLLVALGFCGRQLLLEAGDRLLELVDKALSPCERLGVGRGPLLVLGLPDRQFDPPKRLLRPVDVSARDL